MSSMKLSTVLLTAAAAATATTTNKQKREKNNMHDVNKSKYIYTINGMRQFKCVCQQIYEKQQFIRPGMGNAMNDKFKMCSSFAS